MDDFELSDLSLSADRLAQDDNVKRSRDERMTSVVFNDVVHTLEVQPDSERYEKPLDKFVWGKHGAYITISRRACAYAGLTKYEITIRRMKMAKSGRWTNSAL